MTQHYPGRRLSFNGALCTVRYFGPLPDQSENWLGVEWDDPDRGKHDGQYKGKRLFQTLSPSPICASFIRATRVADEPRTFLQALGYKYAEDGQEPTTVDTNGTIEISGKVVEEVGFERIRQQQAILHNLKIVLLDGLRIRGAGAEEEAEKLKDGIASSCPNITELDLSRNLFERWEDIANVCEPLKILRVLKASGLRLMDFDSKMSPAFRNVEELHLNDGLFKPDQILDMLCRRVGDGVLALHFPSLRSLSIAGNDLSTFRVSMPGLGKPVFTTIKTLIMDMNNISSFVPLCISLLPFFPNLTTLSLQHNEITTFDAQDSASKEPLRVYPSITTLNLSDNVIATPSVIASLSQLFPSLTSLRVSGNPFFSSPTNSARHGSEDAAFMLTLARLPTLTVLNYSSITDKDRLDGELYYLSVAEKEIQKAFLSMASPASDEVKRTLQNWARYDELCRKYDRENVVEKLAAAQGFNGTASAAIPSSGPAKEEPKYPPNSLGARLVTFHFHFHRLDSNSNGNQNSQIKEVQPIILTLPRTLDVYRVKGLLMRKGGREWGLGPLDFVFEIVHNKNRAETEEEVSQEIREEEEELEEIPDSTRRIGDWVPEGVGECAVRVKPRTRDKTKEVDWETMDLSNLITMTV